MKLDHFLTLPDERLLLAKRKHWLTLDMRLAVLFIFSILAAVASFFLFAIAASQPTLFASSTLVILLLTTTLATKLIVDWYCHLYIVTTRKILEVCYSPLFFDHVSEVLLDQVRVTEVDVNKNGVVNELFDIGNVVITFDRPTHQQECMLSDIQNAEEIGLFLGGVLVDEARRDIQTTVWYRQRKESGKQGLFRFTEEIFPGSLAGAN